MITQGAPDFSKPSLDSSIIPAVDKTYGLQDVKLGTPLAQLDGLKFQEQRNDLTIYTRPTDSLKIGLAIVDFIEYGFKQGILEIIILGFADRATGSNLRNVFSKVYGRGFGTSDLVVWKGHRSEIVYTVREGGSGYLAFHTLNNSALAPD